MKSRSLFAVVFAIQGMTPGVAFAQQGAPSGLALQQVQSKEFETSADLLFAAVVSVFQDDGYRITQADKSSGFVTGLGSAQQKTTYNFWFGLGKKKTVPAFSALIEQRGPNLARVRLNFVLSEQKSRNSFSDEKPVTDPAAYQKAFERIAKELFVRQSMMNATPPPAPSNP